MNKLEGESEAAIKKGLCPFCGAGEWLEGPSGGMSQNIECQRCGTRLNILGPFGAELLSSPSKPYVRKERKSWWRRTFAR